MTPELFGWTGAALSLFVSVPQLANVGKVSRATYCILSGVHVCYGTAGALSGNYWLTLSGAWGLVVCGVILRRLSRHDHNRRSRPKPRA